jgi:hypothetical protein
MHPVVHLVASLVVVAGYVLVTGDTALPVVLAVPLGVLVDVDHVVYALYYLPDATRRVLRRLDASGLYRLLSNDLRDQWEADAMRRGVQTYLGAHGAVIAIVSLVGYLGYPSPVIPLTLMVHFLLDLVNTYRWGARYPHRYYPV